MPARWARRPLTIGLPDPPRTDRVGIEHEYAVWSGAEQQDFRPLLSVVADTLRCLDPGDPRARRLPSGCSLTADGREAEIATPPLPVDRETPQHLDRLLLLARTQLAAELAALGVDRLTGFSTHVNVSVPDDRVVEVGSLFARHVALAAVIVAEPQQSAGLLVRPRRRRLEIGGEYAEGSDLIALVTLVVAATAGLLAGTTPPAGPALVVVPSREKFGWHLPPEGPVRTLLDQGPRASWTVEGTTLDAREVLARTWAWARPWCLERGLDPGPCDDLVAGGPWRLEARTPPQTCTLDPGASDPVATPGTDTQSRALVGGILAETTWLTWEHVVWGFFHGSHRLFAVLPVDQEAELLRRLDRGELDDAVRRGLARQGRPRRLLVHAQLTGAAWWDEVRPGALVPAERDRSGAVPRVSHRRARRAHVEAGRRPAD